MTASSLSVSNTLLLIFTFCVGVSESQKKPVPNFIPGKMNVSVSQGEIASLPCTVQNLGTSKISWRRMGSTHFLAIGTVIWVQDTNLVVEHKEWQKGYISDWNLVIKEARLEDAGTYECQVIHTVEIKWRVHLSVIERPVHRPGKSQSPRAMNTRQQQLEGGDSNDSDGQVWRDDEIKAISITGSPYVELGEPVYLLCNVTDGTRAPEDLDWFKNGDKIVESEHPNIKITKQIQGLTLISELIIARGKSADSGTYICRSSLEQIASVEVTVLVAESTNIKRGSGSSQITRLPSRSENHAVTLTSVLGCHLTLTLVVALTSLLTFNAVTS